MSEPISELTTTIEFSSRELIALRWMLAQVIQRVQTFEVIDRETRVKHRDQLNLYTQMDRKVVSAMSDLMKKLNQSGDS